MTRFCDILTAAAVLAIAGCASDNMGWKDANSTGPTGKPSYESRSTDSSPDAANSGQRDLSKGTGAASIAALNDADNQFVNEALAGGNYEISASQRALLKSSDDRVKMIAQHMVDDHSAANTQLKSLATLKGARIGGGTTDEQDKMISDLDKLSGTDFDKEYIRQQKAAHEQTIAKFQTASTSINDRDLRDWASSTLPTLRNHLDMINKDAPSILGTDNK